MKSHLFLKRVCAIALGLTLSVGALPIQAEESSEVSSETEVVINEFQKDIHVAVKWADETSFKQDKEVYLRLERRVNDGEWDFVDEPKVFKPVELDQFEADVWVKKPIYTEDEQKEEYEYRVRVWSKDDAGEWTELNDVKGYSYTSDIKSVPQVDGEDFDRYEFIVTFDPSKVKLESSQKSLSDTTSSSEAVGSSVIESESLSDTTSSSESPGGTTNEIKSPVISESSSTSESSGSSANESFSQSEESSSSTESESKKSVVSKTEVSKESKSSEKVEKEKEKESLPKTGETSNKVIIGVAIVAVIAGVALLVFQRKDN